LVKIKERNIKKFKGQATDLNSRYHSQVRKSGEEYQTRRCMQ